ncbi:FkbM family methyltransferase [Knoellia sp. S7-12]|uniref:FkbM family methyltransferase n=1 Tax=Knoellia sp. S7-12 TaxID=3126698 RepID=UPI003366DF7B
MTTHPRRRGAATVALGMTVQSTALDRRTLSLAALPVSARWHLLRSKAGALALLAFGKSATMHVGALRLAVQTTNDVGTLQSSVCDVHDDVVLEVLSKDRPVIVDVGANIGQFSAAVLLFAPTASILAIEPDPEIHTRLAANLAAATSVTTACAAAGARHDILPLGRAVLPVMSTLRRDGLAGYDIVGTVDVEVSPLDDLTEAVGEVDLLKIDVEGFELEALQGAHALMRRTRFLLIELGLARDTSRSNLDVLEAIRAVCPRARVVRFGRPLGDARRPLCQDVLLELWPD